MNQPGMFDDFIVRQPDLTKLGRVETTSPADDAEASKYPRQHGRLPLETLSCNLGDVLDISAGGMRIRSTRLPVADTNSGSLTITISDHPELRPMQARMVWSKKVGWFRHEFGVQFENLPADQTQALSKIAIEYRERRSM